MQSKINDHKFVKGRFITPLNSLENMSFTDWAEERYPEYIWLALIMKHYGRREGFTRVQRIYQKLIADFPDIESPKFSDILNGSDDRQRKIFTLIISYTEKDILAPLSVVFSYDTHPVFSEFFYSEEHSIEERIDSLLEVIEEGYFHQSDFATDIRFLAIALPIMKGKIVAPPAMAEKFERYPSLEHEDEKMRIIRSSIRATEIGTSPHDEKKEEYFHFFWNKVSSLSECKLRGMSFPKEQSGIHEYSEWLHEIMRYLAQLLVAVKPLDDKMFVILGLATFSYKRISELVEHKLFNTISGRSIIRSLIETYILLKYLLQIEGNHENIWRDFQFYGIGQYKLVLLKGREASVNTSKNHISLDLLDILVNEFKAEAFIDIDTSYFDKHNIRKKAELVGESDLYNRLYNYDSSFEHSLWGAVRESSFVKCTTSGHRYHCIPDVYNGQTLKSVWHDAVMVMNKILIVIDETYGVPSTLLDQVIKYEKESFDK